MTMEKRHRPEAVIVRRRLSLDQHPARGPVIPENDSLRHLLYGRRRHIHRVIYSIDERDRVVTVLHIRHDARDTFMPDALQDDED